MSFSFRLRYSLGLIPKAQKIDLAWAELFKMKEELSLIEASDELSRYNELKLQVQSDDFQTKKREINNLTLKGSNEDHLLNELATLEKLSAIKKYFRFVQSSDYDKFIAISKGVELQKYHELEKITQSPDFIHRKKETAALRYKGSPEYLLRNEYTALQKNSHLKQYYQTIASDEYHAFLKIEAAEKGKAANLEVEDLKVKAYRNFLNSSAYKNLLTVEKHDWHNRIEQLKEEVNHPHFLEQEAFLMDNNRYSSTPDYIVFAEFLNLSKNENIRFYLKCINSSAYANFKEINISAALARLNELRLMVEDPEFIQRVDFLRNKKRYEQTAGYKVEMELQELEKPL